MEFDLTALSDTLENDAAIRRIQQLQPAGGRGDTILPPTYPADRQHGGPPRHVLERRRTRTRLQQTPELDAAQAQLDAAQAQLDAARARTDTARARTDIARARTDTARARLEDGEVWCVLVDSVQSQANRLEEALLEADGDAGMLPYITVNFRGAGLEPLEQITSMEAPHRVYDAILRDSLHCGTPFMESEQGHRLAAAKMADATALLELSPNALLFGAWHSQGQSSSMGAKFPRVIVSEIIAVDVPVEKSPDGEMRPAGRRTESRIDSLGVHAEVGVYKSAAGWDTDQSRAGKGAKPVRSARINHGNILPRVKPLGVTCDYVEHRAVITLAGLRRLRFGGGKRDAAGRQLIAALGLLALVEQDARGYALRSRCDLVCDGGANPFERVHPDGSTTPFELDRTAAKTLYREAYAVAEEIGFQFKFLTLEPQAKLVEIVRRSRELALEGTSAEEGGE